jgi:catechol 2,3-dioxygenase-like lactoylglutathione lyase family enzyme
MAAFYGRVFGWQVTARDDDASRLGGSGWILLSGPDGGPTLSFQAEPWYEPPTWPEERGALTKMMHLEVVVDDLDSAVARVVDAGGRLAPHQPEGRDDLRVVLDPAGHPFCLCTS